MTDDQQSPFLTLLALTPFWFITLNWIGRTDPFLVGVPCLCWA